ncbi:hypothetical protein QTO34_005429 [Cnephaeus nilssonii]|uniref:Uncharacterized protein n=1 Tax=Cnephaeus nilssonii TaxID=3371016 RepID=A0AA40LJX5_CNENI|nr:hypothetical protein QTO34_005429 [Eptesicus nilssonii]
MSSLPQRPLLFGSTAMAQTLSSYRELSVPLAQSATPATPSPAPCASRWPNPIVPYGQKSKLCALEKHHLTELRLKVLRVLRPPQQRKKRPLHLLLLCFGGCSLGTCQVLLSVPATTSAAGVSCKRSNVNTNATFRKVKLPPRAQLPLRALAKISELGR